MDIELLRTVVAELAAKIPPARIAKIHQSTADLLVLRLWTGQQNLKLLISASPQDGRIHLTERSFPNPLRHRVFASCSDHGWRGLLASGRSMMTG